MTLFSILNVRTSGFTCRSVYIHFHTLRIKMRWMSRDLFLGHSRSMASYASNKHFILLPKIIGRNCMKCIKTHVSMQWYVFRCISDIRQIPGVSEKSDEFITCIFRVALGMERRMWYHVKACSKIFCLSGNPRLGVIVLGSARAFSWCPPLPVPRRPVQRPGPLPLGLQS